MHHAVIHNRGAVACSGGMSARISKNGLRCAESKMALSEEGVSCRETWPCQESEHQSRLRQRVLSCALTRKNYLTAAIAAVTG